MGTLSLALNGVATTTIPGSPATGDTILLANGTCRISFVYKVHATSPARWWLDKCEYSPDGGTSWLLVAYCRDTPRFNVNGGGGDVTCTNAALSIITQTAAQITVQLQSSGNVASGTNSGKTGTLTSQYTMNATNIGLKVVEWLGFNGTISLTSNQFIEQWGHGYWTTGLGGACKALYEGIGSTFDSNRVRPVLWEGQRGSARSFARPANSNARSYHGGMCLYLANGVLATFIASPAAYQNLILNVQDTGTSKGKGGMEWQFSFETYNSFLKSTDNAYVTQTDNQTSMIRPGARFGDGSNATVMAAATSTTDATTTINHEWMLLLEQPALNPGHSLPVPRWIFPWSINKWVDSLYPRPNVAGVWSGMVNGLATWEAQILPTVASTYSANFDNTWGYQEHVSDNTTYSNFSNALGLQAVLRHANLGIGNGVTDALAMADKLAVIICNYAQQGTTQSGAIQKIRNTTPNTFTCQDTTHQASADQPHVASYTMAEALYALLEYYKVRGNVAMTCQWGTTTLAAVLDAAMAFLLASVHTDGGWLVEVNNALTFTSTNGRIGRAYPGSSTLDFAASLLDWATFSPTASSATKASWQQTARRAMQYWLRSEISAHGCYEYGEDYVNYSSHAAKMNTRACGRLYRITGAPVWQEMLTFYYEISIYLCKRIDEIEQQPINGGDNGTNNQIVHTGGMMSTIDFSGIEAGEITNSWAMLLSSALAHHASPQPHDYFYLWASLMHMTWAYRDLTYLLPYPFSYAYCSPGTAASGFASGIDNTRFTYFATGAALHLIPVQSLITNINTNVLVTCLEGDSSVIVPPARHIVAYNPQSSSQTTTVVIKGFANRVVTKDGTALAVTNVGNDVQLSFNLAAGQIAQILAR